MSQEDFPRPGSWTVKLSKFSSPDERRIAPETRMEISAAAAGWVVTVTSGSEPPAIFGDAQAVGDSLVCERGNQFFILRPLGRGHSSRILGGTLLKRKGRGDTPIGTWVAEEDTRPPDGCE